MEFAHDALRAFNGRHIGIAHEVVAGGLQFMLGLSEHESVHAAARFRREAAVGITHDEFFEDVKSFARSVGIAFGKIFARELIEPAVGFVQGRKRLQIHHVVGVGVVRVSLQEPVGSLHGARCVAILPCGINQFNLRLLGVLTKGIAGFQLLIVVLCLRPVAIIEGYARFAVELLGAPIERLILVKALQP